MENNKQWEKPEITILFSGNVSENVMWDSWESNSTQSQDDAAAAANGNKT